MIPFMDAFSATIDLCIIFTLSIMENLALEYSDLDNYLYFHEILIAFVNG